MFYQIGHFKTLSFYISSYNSNFQKTIIHQNVNKLSNNIHQKDHSRGKRKHQFSVHAFTAALSSKINHAFYRI